jgi:hypothetical protein
MNKYIEKMTGFKATNADMTCKEHKFELGKWYEVEGELEMCKRGFHFCVHPSGVYSYYADSTVRVFTVEAEQILEVPTKAGADFKLVAKRIRLVKEVTPGKEGNDKSNTGDRNTGDRNTGDRNTGNRNTGNWNTGNWNTGNRNTGYWNTGNRNTGYGNTGDRNTGYGNTGNRNTGNGNTGNRNTGNRNTGYGNTGNRNTGNRNTGDWNTTNYSSGFFCTCEPLVISFDKQTKLTRKKFLEKYPEVYRLGELLQKTEDIKFNDFKNIPGITKAKLASLHKKHLEARKLTT